VKITKTVSIIMSEIFMTSANCSQYWNRSL